MTDTIQESRHLPTEHAKRMTQLESGPLTLDGRSLTWVERLAETRFIEAEIIKEKKRTVITAKLTENGKYALERDKRGVDPYLRMT